jgi:hypothetical protein
MLVVFLPGNGETSIGCQTLTNVPGGRACAAYDGSL